MEIQIPDSYHGFDPFWEEEAVVQCVHGVIRLHRTLSLQQDGAGVQPIISPEHSKTSFFISMDQGPEGRKKKQLFWSILENILADHLF